MHHPDTQPDRQSTFQPAQSWQLEVNGTRYGPVLTVPVNRGRPLTRDSESSLSRQREPGTDPRGRVRAGCLG